LSNTNRHGNKLDLALRNCTQNKIDAFLDQFGSLESYLCHWSDLFQKYNLHLLKKLLSVIKIYRKQNRYRLVLPPFASHQKSIEIFILVNQLNTRLGIILHDKYYLVALILSDLFISPK